MTIFLIKLSICWGVFALLYVGLLRKETFFWTNRLYLLATLLSGIALAAWPVEQIPVPVDDTGFAVVAIPVFSAGLREVEVVANGWERIDFVWLLYLIGCFVTGSRMLWGLFHLARMIRRGETERLADGTVLVRSHEAQTPFSFFHWIFIQAADEEFTPGTLSMLAHERAHARGWHSLDVLLLELLSVVFWFHPLIHWYRRAIRAVHEYLADAEASRLSNRKQYGLLLIGQSQSGMPIAFANHFFQSPLKQRLVMLTKKTSSPVRALKFGLALPLTLLFALVFRQVPAIAQAVEAPASKTADATPSFPGGMNALMEYLGKNVQYPESAKAASAEGMVVVKFTVGMDGSLTGVQEVATKQPKHPDLVKEAIRAVSAMPKWVPAVEKGKIVKKEYTLPIAFRLDLPAPALLSEVEQAPAFPGGESEMFAFLVKNIQYPEAARKEGATGLVVTEFVVETDGSLSFFNTLRSPRPDFAEEAIRVLKLMPKFNPAMKNSKAVRVKYTLPVKFKL